jgi:hypothetical protein
MSMENEMKKEKVVQRDKSVFEILSTKNVSEHTRVLKVNGKNYSYLSWADVHLAVNLLQSICLFQAQTSLNFLPGNA